MVFACLMLSVFATIDEYERTASAILFYMVSLSFREGQQKNLNDPLLERDDHKQMTNTL